MGSLIGHILPGTAFLILSIFWSIDLLCRYFVAKARKRPLRIRPSSNPNYVHDTDHQLRRRPWDLFIAIILIVVGMCGEFYTALDQDWHFQRTHNAQHMTMFGFFLFPIIFELLYFYKLPGLPPSLDRIAGAMAFAVEAVLFVWHLQGRSPIDIQVHTLLVYAVVMCSAFVTLEVFFPDDIRPCLLRCLFVFVQGIWFYCIGFILYPPTGWKQWQPDDHHEMLIVTMLFTWCIGAAIVFEAVLALSAYKWVQRRVDAMGVIKTSEKNLKEYTSLLPEDDGDLSV